METQPKIIKKYLESLHGDWIPGNQLANFTTEWGWLSERACRTARKMAEKGEIEKKMDWKNGKHIVFYRARQPIRYKDYWSEGKLVARVPIFN